MSSCLEDLRYRYNGEFLVGAGSTHTERERHDGIWSIVSVRLMRFTTHFVSKDRVSTIQDSSVSTLLTRILLEKQSSHDTVGVSFVV